MKLNIQTDSSPLIVTIIKQNQKWKWEQGVTLCRKLLGYLDEPTHTHCVLKPCYCLTPLLKIGLQLGNVLIASALPWFQRCAIRHRPKFLAKWRYSEKSLTFSQQLGISSSHKIFHSTDTTNKISLPIGKMESLPNR